MMDLLCWIAGMSVCMGVLFTILNADKRIASNSFSIIISLIKSPFVMLCHLKGSLWKKSI